MGSDRGRGRGPLIVVGTLNCTVPTKMLQFKVPTNIRGPPISLFVLLPVLSPLDACRLMVVGTLNCSPVSLPRFRVPTTILSRPLSDSLSHPLSRPLSRSLSRPLSCNEPPGETFTTWYLFLWTDSVKWQFSSSNSRKESGICSNNE